MKQSYIVDEIHHRWRLDKFLVEQKLAAFSRSALQHSIERGEVTVNGKHVTKHHFLNSGDRIEMNIPGKVQKSDVTNIRPQVVPILFEDEEILVINKPMGVLVHPTEHSNEWTIVSFLLEYHPSIQQVGEDQQRPGIVHRLDRDVSGVMIVAKTSQAFMALKEQFQQRMVKKEYRAIVHGVPTQIEGVIELKIAR